MYPFQKKSFIFISLCAFGFSLSAQTLPEATLNDLIQFSLQNQANVIQSKIDQSITLNTNRSAKSAWFPQINAGYNFQHDYKVNDNTQLQRPENNSAVQLTANQTLFNRDLWRATATSSTLQKQSDVKVRTQTINTIVAVSKAYYDVLLNKQKIKLSDDDIKRLEQSLAFSKSRFDAGLVDKSDYQRATISLNNSRALRKINQNNLDAAYSLLKEQMGYPQNEPLQLLSDSLALAKQVEVVPQGKVDFDKRPEYETLKLQQTLVNKDLTHSKMAFIPNLSLFGGYNWNFSTNGFSQHFKEVYPGAYVGLNLSIPIFQGNKKHYDINVAKLRVNRVTQDIRLLENSIDTDYALSIAGYRSNYLNYINLKENLLLATEVYQLIQYQYEGGIKTYIELVTAETDLRSAEINYWTSLFETLKSKVDVERALGLIN